MKRWLALAAGMVMCATTVAAQAIQSGSRSHIDAGLVADLDPNSYGSRVSGAAGGMFAVGTPLRRGWTVRFEAAVPAWHEARDTWSCSCFGSVGTVASREQRHRISTYAALVGHDFQLARRVQLTPLIGAGVADHADEGETRFTPSPAAFASPATFNDHEPMLIVSFGADVPIALSSRVALVPQFRIHAIAGYDEAPPIFRPGLALRWSF